MPKDFLLSSLHKLFASGQSFNIIPQQDGFNTLTKKKTEAEQVEHGRDVCSHVCM